MLRYYRNYLLVTALSLKPDNAARLGEQRVILSVPDIEPREYPRASLPHDDRAGIDTFPAVSFDAKPLAV